MSDGPRPLDARHHRLVELRAAGETVEACAAKLAIDRATAFRWLARPDVRAALVEAQAAGRAVAAGILRGHAARAAEVLGEALTDPDSAVRVRAAAQVLDRVGLPAAHRLEHTEAEGEGPPVFIPADRPDLAIVGGVRYRRDPDPEDDAA